jgi:hypothetical protein
VHRALTERDRRPPPERAAIRHRAGSVVVAGAFDALSPWLSWLGLRPDLLDFVPRVDPSDRRRLELRYGLTGSRPLTLEELAEIEAATPSATVRALARAEAQLRRLRRSGT